MTRRIPESELHFTFSRSSGAGGQNVNKVNTRVTLSWIPATSGSFTNEEKERLLGSSLIQQRLNRRGELLIISQETRSQDDNRELARLKLESLVARALAVPKKRYKTKPSRASRERRIGEKKLRGEIKRGRSRRAFE